MAELSNQADIQVELEVRESAKEVITPINLRPGLVNSGNECFINAVMQCLAVSPFIHEFIEKYKKDDDETVALITKYGLNRLKTDVLPIAIRKLLDTHPAIPQAERVALERISKKCTDLYIYICFKEIMKALQGRRKPVESCGAFLTITRDIAKESGFAHLFSGEQNDPHEFMVYLLDRIHNAKASNVKINIPATTDFEPDKLYLKLYLEHFKKRYERDFSLFVKNFYYYMLNCIECSRCEHVSYEVSPNDIMCVSLPENWQRMPRISLDECIADYFKVEAIDYRCEKCGNRHSNRQDKKLLTRPKTIIIKLKRYTQMGNMLYKVNKFISYPPELSISGYLCSGEVAKYELYGVINHAGFMNTGHYYSFIRDYIPGGGGGAGAGSSASAQGEGVGAFSPGWMLCNDTQVAPLTEEDAFASKNAYILFYHSV